MPKLIAVVVALLAAGSIVCFSSMGAHAPRPALAASAPVSTPAQLAKAAQCEKVLRNRGAGLWQHYQTAGDAMTVDVGPLWTGADFDTKEALNDLLRCVGTQGRMDNTVTFVDYLDNRTHHTVAEWTPDLSLDVK
ncbi:MAG: hypothetical protein WCA44_17880 [Acidobacteriaceae bacterium]